MGLALRTALVRNRVRHSARLLLIAGFVACARDHGPTSPTQTFQIASVVANPVISECGIGSHAAYVTAYLLHLVNTMPHDVSVTGVSSTGQVVRSTRPEEVGMPWNTFAALPFSPSLVASDDYLDVTVTLTSSCLPHPPITEIEFRDVYTTLRVMTTSGVYATPQITTTMIYRPAPSSLRARSTAVPMGKQ